MRGMLTALVVLMLASPAHAQWTVFDPSNLAQTTATAREMVRMATRLPGLDRYRVPPPQPEPVFTPTTIARLARWYLPPEVHRLMAAHAAVIDTADEIFSRGRHHITQSRQLDTTLARAISSLERDVTTPNSSRSVAAALDAVSVSELMARRQTQSEQAMLASLVELEALRAESQRNAEWNALNMRAAQMVPRKYTDDGTGWTKWRQP